MQSANTLLSDENQAHLTATLANLENYPRPTSNRRWRNQCRWFRSGRWSMTATSGICRRRRAAGRHLLADTRVLIGKMRVATDKLDVAIGDASKRHLGADAAPERTGAGILADLAPVEPGLAFWTDPHPGVRSPPPAGPGEPASSRQGQ